MNFWRNVIWASIVATVAPVAIVIFIMVIRMKPMSAEDLMHRANETILPMAIAGTASAIGLLLLIVALGRYFGQPMPMSSSPPDDPSA